MLILVTGVGFTGSHYVTVLIGAGDDVRVLDALLPAAHRTPSLIPNGVASQRLGRPRPA